MLPRQVPSYDAFQRRHSIAVAVSSSSALHNNATDPEHIHSNRHLRNHVLNAKLNRGFRFPTSTQESNDYRTYSAPPSPPQTISNNVSYQEQLHENSRFNSFRRDSISRLHPTNNGGGGPMLPSNISRRRPSILDEAVEPSSSSLVADHILTRRASMPVVPSLPKSRYMLERAPSQQPSRLNQLMVKMMMMNGEIKSNICKKIQGFEKKTPYSRSPELRLRDSLPVEKSTKTSKWEILSKAVEYISMLKRRDYDMENEIAD
ncbi:hypothetical protein EDC96DRAFT_580798 [Choanephora cucurbitarum]|nr:hypothetical protein EDC96DRAFT_580798 [Choanephora cucurbitarum]